MSNNLPARWIPRCSEGKPDGMPRQTNHLVRDATEVMTSLCARLYGRRSARRRAERALSAAQEG